MYINKACRRLLRCVISLTAVPLPDGRREGRLSYLVSMPDLSGPMPAVRPLNKARSHKGLPVICHQADALESASNCTRHSLLVSLQVAARPSHLITPTMHVVLFLDHGQHNSHGNETAQRNDCVLASRTWQSKITDWDEIFRVRASF